MQGIVAWGSQRRRRALLPGCSELLKSKDERSSETRRRGVIRIACEDRADESEKLSVNKRNYSKYTLFVAGARIQRG